VIQHGTAEQAALVRGAIEQASGDRFADVLAAVRSSGALDAARAHGEAEAGWPKRRWRCCRIQSSAKRCYNWRTLPCNGVFDCRNVCKDDPSGQIHRPVPATSILATNLPSGRSSAW
jgi:hypothetical protein